MGKRGSRGRIVLLHFVGQMPFAGIAWQALHYLTALDRLGYEAWYVEDGGANPYDPRLDSVSMDCAYNVGYVRRALEAHGFAGRWAYWDAIGDQYHGLSGERIRLLYAEADGLVNLCGATRLRAEHMACPVRIMVDTDPGYEQVKFAAGNPQSHAYLAAHTHFFTYGANLGASDCPIPLGGLQWRPTRPPVDLALWPPSPAPGEDFTTIATWENKGKDIDVAGSRHLWSKHENFQRLLDIPSHRPGLGFRLALQPPDDLVRRRIEENGWRLQDPRPISADPGRYQEFISGSRAEFTVAKDIYVRPNSGWFSDRSVCYLAAGRPVVTMRTGFDRQIPVGRGLFDFATRDEALAAIDAVAGDDGSHRRAAREIAAEYFGAERVVGQLMAEAGLG